MSLDNPSFDPRNLFQERPNQGQGLGALGGLSGDAVLHPNVWPVANQNVKVRKGLIDGFVKTCERWRLGRAQQMILLGYPNNEIAASPVLDGRARASQDVQDRTGYVLNISIGLSSIFGGSIASEVNWLNTSHRNLADSTPMRIMLSGRMVDMIVVDNLVLRERAL